MFFGNDQIQSREQLLEQIKLLKDQLAQAKRRIELLEDALGSNHQLTMYKNLTRGLF